MKYLSIAASFVACALAVAAQGPIQPCTFTATRCGPLVATVTFTEYEQPGTVTATQSFDCQGSGCQYYTTRNICGPGPVASVTTVTVDAEATTTVDVCSPTPTA